MSVIEERAKSIRLKSEELKKDQELLFATSRKFVASVEEFMKVVEETKKKRLEFMANFAQSMEGLMTELQAFKNYDDLLALSREMLEAIKEK